MCIGRLFIPWFVVWFILQGWVFGASLCPFLFLFAAYLCLVLCGEGRWGWAGRCLGDLVLWGELGGELRGGELFGVYVVF